jgi:hypothetical protein
MHLIGIQILAILFALFMLYINFINYKKGRLDHGGFFLWTTLWVGFSTLTVFPELLNPVIKPLKIIRILDLMMLIAFAILAYISFDNYLKNREIEKKIEKLVRKEALKKTKR